jgi:hypothetical protein
MCAVLTVQDNDYDAAAAKERIQAFQKYKSEEKPKYASLKVRTLLRLPPWPGPPSLSVSLIYIRVRVFMLCVGRWRLKTAFPTCRPSWRRSRARRTCRRQATRSRTSRQRGRTSATSRPPSTCDEHERARPCRAPLLTLDGYMHVRPHTCAHDTQPAERPGRPAEGARQPAARVCGRGQRHRQVDQRLEQCHQQRQRRAGRAAGRGQCAAHSGGERRGGAHSQAGLSFRVFVCACACVCLCV